MSALGRITPGSHIIHITPLCSLLHITPLCSLLLTLLKESAGRVKIVSHSSCRTSAILKYFCPLVLAYDIVLGDQKNRLKETVLLSTHNICLGRQ